MTANRNYGTYTDHATGEEVEGQFKSYEQLDRERNYAAIMRAQQHDTEAGRNYTAMLRDIRGDRKDLVILGALLVLSTYAQHDRGEGLSVLGTSQKTLFTSTKVDFAKALAVSADVAKKTGAKLIEKGYIVKIGKYFYLDNTIAYRGPQENNKHIKLYHTFVRQLVKCKAKDKDKDKDKDKTTLEHIGALYLMIPFISYRDNCLYEDQLNSTGILSKVRLAELIGIGRPYLDKLLNMTVKYKGEKIAVFGVFTMDNTDPLTRVKKKKVKKIVVNPLIFHGDDKETTGILAMFLNNK